MQDIKEWKRIPQQIIEACSVFDEKFFERRRVFNTHAVVTHVMELASGPDRSYLNVLHESLPRLESAAASSFCVARKKVPAYVFSEVRNEILESWRDYSSQTSTLHGLQIYAVDGSTLNVPKGLEKEGFYVNKGSFYPTALLTSLFRISDRMVCDVDFSKDLSERAAGKKMLSTLNSRDLVIYDKGFFSFEYLSDHYEAGVHGLFRVQAGRNFDEIMKFRKSSDIERIVDIIPSKTIRRKFYKNRPDAEISAIKLRLIKYRIESEDHIFASTLLDDSITREVLIDLYYERWKIEEFYKAMKKTLELEKFHSQTANGVEQEIHAASLVWNTSRMMEDFAPDDFKKRLALLSFIATSSELPTNADSCGKKHQITFIKISFQPYPRINFLYKVHDQTFANRARQSSF